MSSITINPNAATDDATQIDNIVSDISDAMDTLNGAINRNIPTNVETTWSDTLKANWEKYYSSDVPEAMAEMKLSAQNLRAAVEEALGYDQES